MLCSHLVADNAHLCRAQRASLSRTTRTFVADNAHFCYRSTSSVALCCNIQESIFTTDTFTIVRQSQIAIANKVAPTRSHLSYAHMSHAVMVDWAYAAMNRT